MTWVFSYWYFSRQLLASSFQIYVNIYLSIISGSKSICVKLYKKAIAVLDFFQKTLLYIILILDHISTLEVYACLFIAFNTRTIFQFFCKFPIIYFSAPYPDIVYNFLCAY